MDAPSVQRSAAGCKTNSVCCDAQKVSQVLKSGFEHPVPTENAQKSTSVRLFRNAVRPKLHHSVRGNSANRPRFWFQCAAKHASSSTISSST